MVPFIQEILGNRAPGTDITSDITLISSNVFTSELDELVYRNLRIERDIEGSSNQEYTFPISLASGNTNNNNIDIVSAQGGGSDGSGVTWGLGFGSYHGFSFKGSGQIQLRSVDSNIYTILVCIQYVQSYYCRYHLSVLS